MTRILLDANLASQLKSSAGSLELCDPNGDLVGHFLPAHARDEVPFSEEELEKAQQMPGGRTLNEILADLEKR